MDDVVQGSIGYYYILLYPLRFDVGNMHPTAQRSRILTTYHFSLSKMCYRFSEALLASTVYNEYFHKSPLENMTCFYLWCDIPAALIPIHCRSRALSPIIAWQGEELILPRGGYSSIQEKTP